MERPYGELPGRRDPRSDPSGCLLTDADSDEYSNFDEYLDAGKYADEYANLDEYGDQYADADFDEYANLDEYGDADFDEYADSDCDEHAHSDCDDSSERDGDGNSDGNTAGDRFIAERNGWNGSCADHSDNSW